MTLTPQERELVTAVSALDANMQTELAGLFGANGFDISLLTTDSARTKLRDWIESKLNEAPGVDVPMGLPRLRGAIRSLRIAMGDVESK